MQTIQEVLQAFETSKRPADHGPALRLVIIGSEATLADALGKLLSMREVSAEDKHLLLVSARMDITDVLYGLLDLQRYADAREPVTEMEELGAYTRALGFGTEHDAPRARAFLLTLEFEGQLVDEFVKAMLRSPEWACNDGASSGGPHQPLP